MIAKGIPFGVKMFFMEPSGMIFILKSDSPLMNTR